MAIDPNDVELPNGPDELRALIADAPELQSAPVTGIRAWFTRAFAALGIVAASPVIAAAEEVVQEATQGTSESGQTGVMAVVGGIVAVLCGMLYLNHRKFTPGPLDDE